MPTRSQLSTNTSWSLFVFSFIRRGIFQLLLDCTNRSISLSSSCTYPSAVLATHCTPASLLDILEPSISIPMRATDGDWAHLT